MTQQLVVQSLTLMMCFTVCSALSEAGEQYVNEEIKRALLGVKQMKEIMGRKEEKHRHLMDALRHSSDKTKVQNVTL